MQTPLIWLHIVGARPNFPKFAPVFSALARRGARQEILHTGQHYDEAMSESFFRELEIPDVTFGLGIGSGTHAQQTASMMVGIESYLLEHPGRVVILYGDTNSALAGALAASKLHTPVIHIEAGLRSFDMEMPEEINRRVVDSVSNLLFTTSPEALENLVNEGIDPTTVIFAGNTMIDSLRRTEPLLNRDLIPNTKLPKDYAVLTLHRPSNVDDPVKVAQIVDTLRELTKTITVVFPIHPRSRQIFLDSGLEKITNLILLPPLNYRNFLALIKFSRVVISDSGGVQEESTAMGIPCLTLRENTERPVTITHGTNRLVALPDLIQMAKTVVENEVTNSSFSLPPLWDGQAGERIGDALIAWQEQKNSKP